MKRIIFLLLLLVSTTLSAQFDENVHITTIEKSTVGVGDQSFTLNAIGTYYDDVKLMFKNSSAGTFTINANAGNTIDEQANIVLSDPNESIFLIKDTTNATNWSIVSSNFNSELGSTAFTQTIFAEESGALSTTLNNGFQWSFGNGDETPQNLGLQAMFSGSITVASLQIQEGTASVEIYINNSASGVVFTTGPPTDINLSISKGDTVNFRTVSASGNTNGGRITVFLERGINPSGAVINTTGVVDGQEAFWDETAQEVKFRDAPTGNIDNAEVGAIAAGSTLGLQQQLLAEAGQPAKTVLAVGFTTSGKVQGVSLGDGNVIEVYASGTDYNNGTVLYREFMSLGEPICFTGLSDGAIITSTQGFYGFSEQVQGSGESPMPLLSYGLSFKSTFLYAFRNSNVYDPGGNSNNQGWIHVVNGPLNSSLELTTGTGAVVQGQTGIELEPWAYHRLYTSGNQEYVINSTNPVMACISANNDPDATGNNFYDSRLVMPLTNDGITWPRSGFVSAPYDNTVVNWYTRDNAEGSLNNGLGVSPGSPIDFDAAPPTGTGANDTDYEPNGATRVFATGLISAYSGADSAGLEASPLMPTSAMSQVVAQPLFIADTGDGGDSGVAIASPYVGTAFIYEWNTTTSSLDLAYTVPLTRSGVTVTSKEDQKHPAAGLVANEASAVTLVGQLNPGVIISDVPITVIVQNGDPNLTPTIRSQNGTTTTGIVNQDDETLTLGWTPTLLKAEVKEGADNIIYKRVVNGGVGTWNEG